MTCPVIKFESLEAKNTYEGPSSAGWPARPWSGIPRPNPSIESAGREPACNAVITGPGATAFTRMPRGASLTARERVKLTIAPFVEL